MENQIKTTKYTVSIGFKIHEPKIMEAKTYLKKEFNNKYDVEPHFNFVITAIPEYRIKDIANIMDTYFENKKPITLKFEQLEYDPKSRFFSIPLIGNTVIETHKELLNILNSIRDNYIREKDLKRINDKRTNLTEEKYIYKYGFPKVLDNFTSHITIGNIITTENINLNDIQNKLNKILSEFYNSDFTVNKMYASIIEDAEIQTDCVVVWEKEYILQ